MTTTDEGISGTKIKKRESFQKLMEDAKKGEFNIVIVKDISRFARNTVDFLQSIRQLKALGIETIFLTSNQTVLGNSEFVLTIFGALAQEESANTSKRVKFGKKINAEKGRVPNFVYGYDKIKGDYFNLTINEKEAEVVKKIFNLYLNEGNGANKIAQILNSEGYKTKRNCNWSQNAISRILTNPIYTGKIINGKEEVEDFLKIKKRESFQKLMEDAKKGEFNIVIVKDISRFARNTVDFLQSIRQLKALGIETIFLTSNQTVLGNSEFVLTIFGALAQEESANTSKRVKFGKKINAEKGRVPNFVYGYDKIKGDYFNLTINEKEAEVVKKIFNLYLNEGNGANKIAQILNSEGYKTKRNCNWSQNAISRILTNPIYTGKIINGKEEVEDFLTGVRKKKDSEYWHIIEKPELSIINNEDFEKVQAILKKRNIDFNLNKQRESNKHLFSTLIRCSCCGYSFRRLERVYRNTYIKWVCSGRNAKGRDSCPN